MNVLVLLHAFGSASLFASRVFIPALLTAALLRFGPHIQLVASTGLLDGSGAPLWFTSDICLITLVVLSALELLADRVPEVQEAATAVEPWLKPALAAATSLGVLQAGDASFAGSLVGLDPALLSPAVAAAATFGTVQLRAPLLGALRSADPDDALHLQRVWRWLETSWVLVGAVVLVVVPLLMAGLLVLAAAGLALLRRHLRSREAAASAPCSGCGQPVWLAAPHCAACGQAQLAPRAVGALGQVRAAAAPADHGAALLGQLRCPRCASRLRRGGYDQTCKGCGLRPLACASQRKAFVAAQTARLPQRLALVFVLSLLPVAGYIAAATWSGLVIEAPLRAHLRLTDRVHALFWLRLLRAVVLLLQLAPLLGAVVALAEARLRFVLLRRTFLDAI